MQPACVFMGSLVHKIIEEQLKAIQQSRQLPALDELIRRASVQFDRGLKESKEQLWKHHPKHHVNILEHFFGFAFGSGDETTLKEKAITCLTNWHASPCLNAIALHQKAEWMGIEANQTFSVEQGIEAIVVYDFFLRWPKADGSKIMIIFDWKTGQESKKTEDQLFAYALAAQTLFGESPESMILVPFYLCSGPAGYKKYGAGQKQALDAAQLTATRSRIIESTKKMLSLHPPPDAQGLVPPPDPSLFAYPEDRRGCRRCPFQELCAAADFQQKTLAELRTLIPAEISPLV